MVQWHHGQRGGPQVSAAARKRPAQSILGAEEKVPEPSRSTFRLVKFKPFQPRLILQSCEEGIVKLRNARANPQTPVFYVVNQILFPVQEACKTKDVRVVRLAVGVMQRLVTQQVVDHKCAAHITDTLWFLMEAGIEEVKVLQTVTLLLTTNAVVHGDTLSRVNFFELLKELSILYIKIIHA